MTGTYNWTRHVVMSCTSPLHCFVSSTICIAWVRTDQTVQCVTTKEQAIPVFVTPRVLTGYANLQGLSHAFELILHIIAHTMNTVLFRTAPSISYAAEYFKYTQQTVPWHQHEMWRRVVRSMGRSIFRITCLVCYRQAKRPILKPRTNNK
jgi:hypothetical protein